MAPEQFGEGEICPATDVHALGVMLFERLCGVWPFPCDGGFLRLTATILANERPSPLEHAPDAPRGLAAVACRAIARLPENRYEDGNALADALDAWLAGPEWWQRRPVQAAGAAGLSLLALALGGWALRSPPTPELDPDEAPALSQVAASETEPDGAEESLLPTRGTPPAPRGTRPPSPRVTEGQPSPETPADPPEPDEAPVAVRLSPELLLGLAKELAQELSADELQALSARLRREVLASLEDPGPRLFADRRASWEGPIADLERALARHPSGGAPQALAEARASADLLAVRVVRMGRETLPALADRLESLVERQGQRVETQLLVATQALVGLRASYEIPNAGFTARGRREKLNSYRTRYEAALKRAGELAAPAEELAALRAAETALQERFQ